MDKITERIKKEIKRQYKSVRCFSETYDIPYSTLSNALSHSVSGSAFSMIRRICDILGIRLDSDDTAQGQDEFYAMLVSLDERGRKTVEDVISVEYARCNCPEELEKIKAFSGITPFVRDGSNSDVSKSLNRLKEKNEQDKK